MEKTEQILNSFHTISLKEMEAVELMNRKDTKYFFDACKLPVILASLQPDYRVMSIDEHRVFNYRNIYFDTENFFCYYQHHNERINRYKIRIRQYVESNLNFLEVKFKTNTKRTIKTRIKVPEFLPRFTDEAKRFLLQQTPFDPAELIPTLQTDFKRFTLVSKTLKERATVDTDLTLMTEDGKKIFTKLCIAELKHDVSASGSMFKVAMRENFCPELRISKYSIGAAFMYPALKQNNWKEKKIRINRIEYA